MKWLSCPFCGWTPSLFGNAIVNKETVKTCIHPVNGCALSSLVFDEVRWNNREKKKSFFLKFFKSKRLAPLSRPKNCLTCKFAEEGLWASCKVFYTKYATCYNGELWEKK
jgi:hypothetical protein